MDRFLEEIARNPSASEPRILYANWLEELGDPRAELLRIFEESRSLSVCSDRYWELKARRRTLLEGVSPAWVRDAQIQSKDIGPVFRDVKDDWKSRWRLIREFVHSWYGTETSDVVADESDFDSSAGTANAAGTPPSLIEWEEWTLEIAEGDEWKLRDVSENVWYEEHNAFCLAMQAEGDVRWCVRGDDFSLVDPPVHMWTLDWDSEEGNEFVYAGEFAPSVTQFALEYALAYPHGVSYETQEKKVNVPLGRLQDEFSKSANFGECQLFEDRNILLAVYQNRYGEDECVKCLLRDGTPSSSVPGVVSDLFKKFHARQNLPEA